MEGKHWWASKTIIVNSVALVAMVLSGIGFDLNAELQASLVGGVLAIINIVLRLVTSEAIVK